MSVLQPQKTRWSGYGITDLVISTSRTYTFLPSKKWLKDYLRCKECIECEQARSSFNKYLPTKAIEKFNIIHFDVCGLMQVETPGDNRYFISFIDDLTIKVWVYMVKGKHEVLEVFRRFKCLVEKQSGKVIKILRTNGGVNMCQMISNSFLKVKGYFMK